MVGGAIYQNIDFWRLESEPASKSGHLVDRSFILQRVPELRVTADISHWVVVCERLLDQGEEDREILDRLIPHVRHIHARMGTTQSSQCPEPLNPAFGAERQFFESL
ncbi:hypothetical protein ABZX51_010116 [Aspergillus tubingensis]